MISDTGQVVLFTWNRNNTCNKSRSNLKISPWMCLAIIVCRWLLHSWSNSSHCKVFIYCYKHVKQVYPIKRQCITVLQMQYQWSRMERLHNSGELTWTSLQEKWHTSAPQHKPYYSFTPRWLLRHADNFSFLFLSLSWWNAGTKLQEETWREN